MKNLLFTATAIATATMLFSCSRPKPTDTNTSGMASIMCDESFENIMGQEIDVFEYTYPNASIIPFYVSEKEAVDSLLALKTKLIIAPHELQKEQIEYLKSKQRNVRTQRIAVDAIAIIANNENPIEELSIGELGDILTGKIKDWNDISPNKTGEIMVVFDHQGSSTVKYMRDSVTHGTDFGENVYAQGSNREVFDVVKKRRNAIGIIGVTWLNSDLDKAEEGTMQDRMDRLNRNDTTELASEKKNKLSTELKVVAIRRNNNPVAYKPFQYYIYTGDYPLYRSVYAISTAANGSLAHGFYTFLTGVISQKIILNTGILPAIIPLRNVELQ